MTEHFKKLQRMYAKAPINEYYQPTLLVEHQKATVTIMATRKMHHTGGGVHGSVYFKLLDDAAFFAANSIETSVFVLTSDFHIRLLRPFTEGPLRATGWVTHVGRRNILACSELYDDQDRLIGTGQGSFSRSSILLNSDCGYV